MPDVRIRQLSNYPEECRLQMSCVSLVLWCKSWLARSWSRLGQINRGVIDRGCYSASERREATK
jgi:hypothetical protein